MTPGKFPYIIGGYRGKVEASNNRQLARAGTGAIQNNTRGTSDRIGRVITSITPTSAKRGSTVKVEINLAARGARPPVPREAPNWFQVGPYKGANIKRRGNVVQAEITIPGEASVGIPLDCHIEFKTPRGHTVVYKKDDAFTIE